MADIPNTLSEEMLNQMLMHSQQSSENKLEGLEQDRLKECFKNEEFRSLLVDYMKEISDPKAKKEYEQYIEQSENARVVAPQKGFVIECVSTSPSKPVCINVCYSDEITELEEIRNEAKKGYDFSIPYLLTPTPASAVPPRGSTFAPSSTPITTVDIVFGKDTVMRAMTGSADVRQNRFKSLICQTAVEAVEKRFQFHIKRSFQFPNAAEVNYIGKEPQPQIVRDASMLKPKAEGEKAKEGKAKVGGSGGKPVMTAKAAAEAKREKAKAKPADEPAYTIVERGGFHLSDTFTGVTGSASRPAASRPEAIVIKVELPLLDSMSGVDLDVDTTHLQLVCNKEGAQVYVLNLPLPYPVQEEKGKAKFNKHTKTLSVTLPVVPPPPPSPRESLAGQVGGEGEEEEEMELKLSRDEGSAGRPLIEEVTPPPSTTSESAEVGEGGKKQDSPTSSSTSASAASSTSSSGWTVCTPSYTCYQDEETVTVILDVASVISPSFKSKFLTPKKVMIACASAKAGSSFAVDKTYKLELSFRNMLSSAAPSVDVSAENTVIVYKKAVNGMWDEVEGSGKEEAAEKVGEGVQKEGEVEGGGEKSEESEVKEEAVAASNVSSTNKEGEEGESGEKKEENQTMEKVKEDVIRKLAPSLLSNNVLFELD
eukprot:CAMPEP_0113888700 /NCGR_PEP_ID=MMETSP0780_2-20120614/13026_1 /TAXON_ID=652834 /ORGANISM="Palpitomonas bilix" /LENGTH=651 /DNA_ID=CAMNT_0000877595 /DNA_START=176 /DNA_END=2131 /DNA_ORIENTATION=+ /assembly_acc=CAM_ASM_000599